MPFTITLDSNLKGIPFGCLWTKYPEKIRNELRLIANNLGGVVNAEINGRVEVFYPVKEKKVLL